jgi:putative intracellular protease/amidase
MNPPLSIAMWDLATDATSIKLIREFYDAGRIIVALCHGTAALVNVKLADGSPILAGQRVTGFSDEEEEQAYANKIAPPNMPFDLQQALDKVSGGKYEKAAGAWKPHVIVAPSKHLLFGQNPASAYPLSLEVLKVLQE